MYFIGRSDQLLAAASFSRFHGRWQLTGCHDHVRESSYILRNPMVTDNLVPGDTTVFRSMDKNETLESKI